jgi:hypothetical protein
MVRSLSVFIMVAIVVLFTAAHSAAQSGDFNLYGGGSGTTTLEVYRQQQIDMQLEAQRQQIDTQRHQLEVLRQQVEMQRQQLEVQRQQLEMQRQQYEMDLEKQRMDGQKKEAE